MVDLLVREQFETACNLAGFLKWSKQTLRLEVLPLLLLMWIDSTISLAMVEETIRKVNSQGCGRVIAALKSEPSPNHMLAYPIFHLISSYLISATSAFFIHVDTAHIIHTLL